MLVMGCDVGSKGGRRASWEPVSGEESRERDLGKMCPGPWPSGKRSVEIKEAVGGSWVGLTHKLGRGL